ncbi:AbrB/MazE/SpoVT family DNA-binding domain-containing protein [soil metagenome]
MRTTMDRAGRLVVPKALRERLGLPAGGEVELVERDGVVEISQAPVTVRVEQRDFGPVLVADDAPPLTDEDVRDILDQVRR